MIEAFTLITTVSSVLFMVVWSLILAAYLVYRRKFPERHKASSFKVPGGRFMCWVVLAFFAFMVVVLTFENDTRSALMVTPIWFVILFAGWYLTGGAKGAEKRATQ